MSNKTLHEAKRQKADEFYTQLCDIEKELKHYKSHFEDKIVLCNCDDPFESNFFKYFALNFNSLKLKKLIATCYDSSPIAYAQQSLFSEIKEKVFINQDRHAYKIVISEVDDFNNDGAVDLSDVRHLLLNDKNTFEMLKGNGDFRSDECVELLKNADIVVTNPPFSLFRDYVALLMKYNKQFLIIGNQNAITYKEIFPLLKDNKVWLGINSGAQQFRVPDYFEKDNTYVDANGVKYAKFGNICWYTNLDTPKRHEKLILYKTYNPIDYPKYDNYDAINVDKVADIPCDYLPSDNCNGDMGVPITFLDKHNPEQFELVKFRKGDDGKDLTYTQTTSDNFDRQTDRQTDESRHTSESLSVERCNGIMGVPITFLDKYNPTQFEIIGIANSARWIGNFPCYTIINGRRIYNRILIRRKA